MKAIIVNPPKKGVLFKDIDYKKHGIKLKIIENGICGTDREIVDGKLGVAYAVSGYDFLVLGHEAIGRVMENGKIFKNGDIVMPINRRGCGRCLNCLNGRADFCETGDFTEAGIKGMHGFMSEYIYDDEKYLVKVPDDIVDIAILAQPLSDLEKSVEEIINIQKRMIWTCNDNTYDCKNALIIGTGIIGILFSLLLKTYGFNVYISNKRDPYENENKIFSTANIKYYNSADGYNDINRNFDLIVEASGSDAGVINKTIKLLKNNGIFGLFGFIRNGTLMIDPFELQNIVYKAISIVGLINGQKRHFEIAMNHLIQWKHMYKGIEKLLITDKININDEKKIISALNKKSSGEIKTKITW